MLQCVHRVFYYRVELGRAYHKLGRKEEAWRELEAAILLDVEDINAHLQKVNIKCSYQLPRSHSKQLPTSNPAFRSLHLVSGTTP